MQLSDVLEKLLKKNFTEEDIQNFVGEYKGSCLASSASDEIRQNAASGGVVSTLLSDALANNIVDGVLVCKTEIVEGKVRSRFFIAALEEEILLAQGSTYVATKFSKEAIPLIRNFKGRVGIVGLPCDLSILKQKMETDPLLRDKVKFTIALVCGHNSQNKLVDKIAMKLEREADSKLTAYRFRKGHWRGYLEATFANKNKIEKPFSYFGLYQNLFFFAEKKCLYCNDHFGYDADISIGDVWSYSLKHESVKFSGIIKKTTRGSELVDNAIERKQLVARTADIGSIVEGQKRIAPFHYNISARHKAGKKLGLDIPDKTKVPVRWHEYISAYIVLFNWKWSQSKKYKDMIFKIPLPIMKTYLYLLKGLESLK